MRCFTLARQCLLITLLFTSSAHAASFKCWTNSEGVRECGNVVPPEYAQKGHEEISESGTVVNKVDRALTAEEIAAQKKIEEDKKRQQEIIAEQKRRDDVLLNTYNNVDEIKLAQKGRLAAIDTELKIYSKNLTGAEKGLRNLYAQAARKERNGKKVPAALQKQVDKAKKQVDSYQRFIQNKKNEKQKLIEQFDRNIVRFKELRTSKLAR